MIDLEIIYDGIIRDIYNTSTEDIIKEIEEAGGTVYSKYIPKNAKQDFKEVNTSEKIIFKDDKYNKDGDKNMDDPDRLNKDWNSLDKAWNNLLHYYAKH